MMEQQQSYRQIAKATALFGGVQAFQIVIQVIRSKFVAVLLGPAGMGVQGLLTATTGLIAGLTNFGLGASAVKNVAAADGAGDRRRIAQTIAVLRRLVWLTGSLGTVATLVLAPWLSEIAFGSREYTLAFAWISVTLLFNQLSSGQLVVLQGLRKLKHLANANLTGALLGMLVSVPLYYFFGIDGIVPAIIASSLLSLLRSWYFAGKVKFEKVSVTRQLVLSEGKDMLKMGFMLSISGLIALGASYLVRIFISHRGGIVDVGLYASGFAIISTYVGLIFKAMGTDFYPRLAAAARDNVQAARLINQQAETAILVLGPILAVFLIFINWLVIALYSTRFLAVSGMIYYAAIGMYFKGASWAVGYILLAKGAAKLFLFSEALAYIYLLLLNVAGYYFWGLDGLGISFLVGYALVLIQILFIAKIKYEFSFNRDFQRVFVLQLALGILCLLCIKFIARPFSYMAGMPLIGLSAWHSFHELDKRMGLQSAWHGFVGRFNKK